METDTFEILVGPVYRGYNGAKTVRFTGEKLGEYCYRQVDGNEGQYGGRIARLTQTLYRFETATGASALLVHSAAETITRTTSSKISRLWIVEERDLLPGGEFEALGAACGFRAYLTVEEGIALCLANDYWPEIYNQSPAASGEAATFNGAIAP